MLREGTLTLTRILLIIGYLIALALWRWIEVRLHTHHTERWEYIRQQGKFGFVTIRYLILRGAILSLLFLGPMFPRFDIRIAAVVALIIIVGMTLQGNQEWSNCESQFHASQLRAAAANLKASQN
jgi:hypothetical protein